MKRVHFYIIILIACILMIIHILIHIDITSVSINKIYSTKINTKKNDNNLVKFAFNISELNHRYRNSTNRINAFKLLREGLGEIILIHVRKAGGTTLKNWFQRMQCSMYKKYCKDYGKDFREAFPQFHTVYLSSLTGQLMDVTKADKIWVISFRDPIMRILSQYDFEWKWLYAWGTYYDELAYDKDSFDRLNYWKHYEVKNETDMKKIEKYKFSSITLEKWFDRINVTELSRNSERHSDKPVRVQNHMYINNYYLWIFCCDSKSCNIEIDFVKTGKIWECLVNSMQLLLNFDLIIITEWMNDMRSHLFVNKVFWNKIGPNIEKRFSQRMVNLPYPHHVKNRGKNLMVNNKLMNDLIELNKWDIIFYSYAKHIAYHRMEIARNENKFYAADYKELLSFKDDTIFKFDAIAPEFKELRKKIIITKDGTPINLQRWSYQSSIN